MPLSPIHRTGIRRLCGLLAFCLGAPVLHADLVNRWSFNNTAGTAPSGTVITDSVSGANATVRGNGSTFSGTALTITGSTIGNKTGSTISGYVNLPNGIVSSKNEPERGDLGDAAFREELWACLRIRPRRPGWFRRGCGGG